MLNSFKSATSKSIRASRIKCIIKIASPFCGFLVIPQKMHSRSSLMTTASIFLQLWLWFLITFNLHPVNYHWLHVQNVCVFVCRSVLSLSIAVIHSVVIVSYRPHECKLLAVVWCIRLTWFRFICHESWKQIGSIKCNGNKTVISKRPFLRLGLGESVCLCVCTGRSWDTGPGWATVCLTDCKPASPG